jgi:hypothetical protein
MGKEYEILNHPVYKDSLKIIKEEDFRLINKTPKIIYYKTFLDSEFKELNFDEE